MGRFYLCSVLVFLMVKTTDTQREEPVCLLVPTTTHECFRKFEGKRIGKLSARINCLQDLFWNFAPDMSLNEHDLSLLTNITSSLGEKVMIQTFAGQFAGQTGPGRGASVTGKPVPLRPRNPTPPSGYRTRKEYRTLSTTEREKFHTALNGLYRDGYIDLFARIHAAAADIHHGGSSFLPWHRVYITMFEEVMRRYDPSVSLPYWASKFDDVMDNPVNSILWTPEYFGNGDGTVTSGPAANWVTAQADLERDIGRGSVLFKEEQIQRVLTQCRLTNISRPTALSTNDLEIYHGGPHVWVGGDMTAFDTTGYDPVFYMHHAYVDYIWEQFRQRQRQNCGIDPSTDYPDVPAGNSNHPDAPMIGFGAFSNKEGIRSYWTDTWFRYEPEPKCPDCCPKCKGPAPLYCDRSRNVCVSRSRLVVGRAAVSVAFAASLAPMAVKEEKRTKNRGRKFEGPPGDGRTKQTALRDAIRATSGPVRQRLQRFL